MRETTFLRRMALYVSFLVLGIAMASWITRTPAIRDAIGASTEQMGLVLFGLSLGSMSGILAASPLVSKFGTRPIAICGIGFVMVAMGIIGTGVLLGKLVTAAAKT